MLLFCQSISLYINSDPIKRLQGILYIFLCFESNSVQIAFQHANIAKQIGLGIYGDEFLNFIPPPEIKKDFINRSKTLLVNSE